MTSNPAPEHKVHNIGLHGSGSGINAKLLEYGAGGSVAQGEVWHEGPWKRATEAMVKPLYFRMLAQESKLKSQISILEARNNEIHVQNEGLCNQVAFLRAAVDSLEQGLKAAQSTTQAQGSTANEARGLFHHNKHTIPEARGDKEQGNGVLFNRQIPRPNLIVSRGKSLIEIPSPNAQPRTARSPNTDTVKHSRHTSLLKPALQFMAIKRNGSIICLNALMSQKSKQLKLLALLRAFGIPWYSYNSIPSRISGPSEPSNQLTCDNAPLAKENSNRSIENLPIRSNAS